MLARLTGGAILRGGARTERKALKVPKIPETTILHGERIVHGWNIPKSKHRTPRLWLPNIQVASLYSVTLGKVLRIPCSDKAIHAIDEKGGLDRYLMKTPDRRLQNPHVIELKYYIKEIADKKAEEQKQLKLKQAEAALKAEAVVTEQATPEQQLSV